ncbi:uncharacterized protein PFL1_01473 [Pseudozyma flocculosa PF-1]|uniref:Uncharacterized protein n=1 Tax=Pseudozyma flocculosa TaxID=84751 RepID=A0A5C3FEF9_9BASI|nr:uncharacterized protein PFL1_01473 [Pseudozyma flocculosa PF-1]EPQ31288.1 hypothetical protein PFL1_01473 [Pseudozyma flocculosa PF-1]SPO41749.1 uncharacterized protein PSFLO_07231 [Pseudozyma flocculosa]
MRFRARSTLMAFLPLIAFVAVLLVISCGGVTAVNPSSFMGEVDNVARALRSAAGEDSLSTIRANALVLQRQLDRQTTRDTIAAALTASREKNLRYSADIERYLDHGLDRKRLVESRKRLEALAKRYQSIRIRANNLKGMIDAGVFGDAGRPSSASWLWQQYAELLGELAPKLRQHHDILKSRLDILREGDQLEQLRGLQEIENMLHLDSRSNLWPTTSHGVGSSGSGPSRG